MAAHIDRRTPDIIGLASRYGETHVHDALVRVAAGPSARRARALSHRDGGYGASAHLDPAEDVAGVLLTTRMLEAPTMPPVFADFWTSAYQAIDD